MWRLVRAAAVAKLHAKDEFLAVRAARADIDRAHKAGLTPTVACEAEATTLSTPLF